MSLLTRTGHEVKVASVTRCLLQMRDTKSLGSHEKFVSLNNNYALGCPSAKLSHTVTIADPQN